ncbi:dipeptide/oligopeptide/nickel ABC transporter permease/ATP-binding protein [Streptomyces sp. Qhu-G9]|uniref:dipeptide/oligopeptide/nickel ABC transporter permease/ATP-binding protein n=1 Tax=Streptomyces sp. Qhu-G9 TaxID=3452799 RepID=UPI0022AC8EA8|nr:dipeptide/oligopeptide/nickel ABC transporter permease/ATP-binding protein [Streptomyces aurantiacus]WAU81260.1 dipeptide/oligopeptide/nickel ABC transporter permease/ATP-binding protein [Streptomyces aurantiacus]
MHRKNTVLKDADHDSDAGPGTGRVTARRKWLALLLQDRFACAAALVLLAVGVCAVLGPLLVGDLATQQNLRDPGRSPFTLDHGWAFVLGSDSLGRPVAARLITAAGTTLSVAVPAVLCSLVIGSVWGMWAGYHGGRRENVSLRIADVILSFPSLLLAVVVLYVFSPSAANIVLVLAVARIPVYLRTARAESAELRSRLFMDAARTFGTGSWAVIRRHVAPTVLPTLLTVAALDFCFVMLTESSLSFLGIGIQPPDVSWGLMVAQGRQELQSSWWIAVFPGLAIVMTTVSATVLAAWARLSTDPGQRWRHGLRRGGRRGGPRGRPATEGTGAVHAPESAAPGAHHGPDAGPAAPTAADVGPAAAVHTVPRPREGADGTATGAQDDTLAVDALSVDIRTPAGSVPVVRGVSFAVRSGETLALLGESGCGKSMTAHAVAGLLDPAAQVVGGQARLEGEDLLALGARARRKLAGPGLAIVFQDALSALNPVQTVGAQLAEPFRIHEKMSRRAAKARAVELMERVGIPEASSRADAYPHQFSGGMRQRLLIAMAVALRPKVLLADEPTTALDVTVQAQIMDLLRELRGEQRMALVLITHDLGLVAEHADRVAVMYAGTVVETGPVGEVFGKPNHPYTRGLLESVPAEQHKGSRLSSIPGNPPDPRSVPSGCAFRLRCPMARDLCATHRPELAGTGAGRAAACHFAKELADA